MVMSTSLPVSSLMICNICVRHYAGRKILDVSVAQPKTCHHRAGEGVCEEMSTCDFILVCSSSVLICSMSLEKDQCLCHTLHIHVSVCVTHYTGPTILASNYTLTLSWPSVMPGPWYPSQAALWASLALGTSQDSSLGL